MPKPLAQLHRNFVVYVLMPLFNALGRRFVLSHRPQFFIDYDRVAFDRLRKHWEIGSAGNNRGDWTRLFFLVSSALDLEERNVEGSVAELGVYRGASAKVLRELLPERPLYLFDTFEGFDARDLGDGDPREGFFHESLERVKKFIGEADDIHYCPGRFPDTASALPEGETFALVHLDMDLYDPTRAACEVFFERLAPGGLLIIHDYHSGTWPGVKRAVDEFFSDKPECPALIPDKSGTAVVIRNERPAPME